MTDRAVRQAATALAVVLAAACARAGGGGAATGVQPAVGAADQGGGMNTLTAQERRAGWRLLFDGKTTAGWRGYKQQEAPPGWSVVDGSLTKDRPTEDIVTRDQFGDFEFAFDWKIAPRGNAGVFYRATEEYEKVYWSATEYQLLDNAGHPDGRNPLTSAGSAYGLYAPAVAAAHAPGEWNSSRVVVRGAHVEHWLNGQKLLEYELWSPDWEAKVKASKFKDWPNYGRARQGLIAIQGDHGGKLELRNIKIRELK